MTKYLENGEQPERAPSVPQLLKWAYMPNIAEDLDDETLDDIGMAASADYEKDEQDHQDFVDNAEKWLKQAKLEKESKSYPWENAANTKFPLLNEAATQFNARAMPALLPGEQVAKAKVVGLDQNGMKRSRAERISKHMSYQLLEEMSGWREDMDRGLMVLPVVGCFFKKTYWDFEQREPVSALVSAQDLIVNDQYTGLDMEDVPCISEPFELFNNQVEEKQRTGQWLDVEFEGEDDSDEDTEDSVEFVEQCRWIDLDEDGYKEPYIVVFHKNSRKVVRVVARYDENNIYVSMGNQLITVGQVLRDVEAENNRRLMEYQQAMAIQQSAMDVGAAVPMVVEPEMVEPPSFDNVEVAKIQAECPYTKYYFMPSMDGSFYEMGLGQITESLSDTVDTNVNQMIDANTLANLQGGFKAKEAKIVAGTSRMVAGEYKDVETKGRPLRESFLPFNFRGPSGQSFSLLQFLVEAGKAVTSVSATMVGEQDPSAPATTAIINQEEGAKVFNAVYQRLYASFRSELRKIYHLNRKYLDEGKYLNVLDDGQAVKRADYSYDETDVQPVADPKLSTLAQRIGEAQLLMQFVQDPEFNGFAIKRRFLEAAGVTNIEEVMPTPDPNAPPSPADQMQMQAMQLEMANQAAGIEETQSKTLKNVAEAGKKQAETAEIMEGEEYETERGDRTADSE